MATKKIHRWADTREVGREEGREGGGKGGKGGREKEGREGEGREGEVDSVGKASVQHIGQPQAVGRGRERTKELGSLNGAVCGQASLS